LNLIRCIQTAVAEGMVGEDGARITRLAALVSSPQQISRLLLELNIVTFVCKPLVQATYTLEGSGPLAVIAYDELIRVKSWLEEHTPQVTFPLLRNEIELYANQNQLVLNNVITEVSAIITPAKDYLLSRVFTMMVENVNLYKRLRYANPYANLLHL